MRKLVKKTFLITVSVVLAIYENSSSADLGVDRQNLYKSTQQDTDDLNLSRKFLLHINQSAKEFSKEWSATKSHCVQVGPNEDCQNRVHVLYENIKLSRSNLVVSRSKAEVVSLLKKPVAQKLQIAQTLSDFDRSLSDLEKATYEFEIRLIPQVQKIRFEQMMASLRNQQADRRKAIICQMAPLRIQKTVASLRLDVGKAYSTSDAYLILSSMGKAKAAQSELSYLRSNCPLSENSNLATSIERLLQYDQPTLIQSLAQKACQTITGLNEEIKDLCLTGNTSTDLIFALHRQIIAKGALK